MLSTTFIFTSAYVIAIVIVFLIFFQKRLGEMLKPSASNLLSKLRSNHTMPDFQSPSFTPPDNYVFWTGGYDSTYRLCELLIVEQKIVRPVYVAYNLDSSHISDFWVRKNRLQEYEAMEKVRQYIIQKFPFTKKRFLPTWYITEDIHNPHFDKKFLKLNLFPKKRAVHQYMHLSKIAYHHKIYIDIGVLGLHSKSKFAKFLNKNVSLRGQLGVDKEHPLHYLRFPLLRQSKKNLCSYSKQNMFSEILQMSWSCWFPKDNEVCGKCPMCRERFQCKKNMSFF